MCVGRCERIIVTDLEKLTLYDHSFEMAHEGIKFENKKLPLIL